MKTPLVSIVITTKNEALHIGACLNSITKQTYKHVEVIVVDNHSSDNTREIVQNCGIQVVDKGPERSAQRNFGAMQSKGEYLLFLDADMLLANDIVEKCVDEIIKSQKSGVKLAALVIPEISIGTGFWANCKALERSFYVGVDWIEAARFYAKEAFNALHGYDESLTGPEDFDIQQRLHDMVGEHAIGRITSCILHNEGSLSLWKTLRKKFYYAKNLNMYSQKVSNRGYYRKQSNIVARYLLFFKNPLKLFHNPFMGIGMLFLKTTEFAAGFCGLVYYSYVGKK